MKPDTGYEAATDATEKSKLEAVKASMTQQVINALHYIVALLLVMFTLYTGITTHYTLIIRVYY
jgi:hypothetical protein